MCIRDSSSLPLCSDNRLLTCSSGNIGKTANARQHTPHRRAPDPGTVCPIIGPNRGRLGGPTVPNRSRLRAVWPP
eukprot:8762748-Alexandrium_andersonii.AAC.1